MWYKLCVDKTDKQIMIEVCGPLEKIANCIFFQRTEILSLSWKLCRATMKRNVTLKASWIKYTWKASFWCAEHISVICSWRPHCPHTAAFHLTLRWWRNRKLSLFFLISSSVSLRFLNGRATSAPDWRWTYWIYHIKEIVVGWREDSAPFKSDLYGQIFWIPV